MTVWQYLLVLVLAAFILARLPTPLRRHDWFLLGLGLTQIPPWVTVLLVLWLVCVCSRYDGNLNIMPPEERIELSLAMLVKIRNGTFPKGVRCSFVSLSSVVAL